VRLLNEFPQSVPSVLSIDAVPAVAILFFRMMSRRPLCCLPQAFTANHSEEIHVHRTA
jgi:hypothetical protein